MKPERIAEDIYLGTLSRFPDADERKLAADAIAKAGDARKDSDFIAHLAHPAFAQLLVSA